MESGCRVNDEIKVLVARKSVMRCNTLGLDTKKGVEEEFVLSVYRRDDKELLRELNE